MSDPFGSETVPVFEFGSRNTAQKSKRLSDRSGIGVQLIFATQQLINFANNTVLAQSQKFDQRVIVRDLSIAIQTSFAAGASITLKKIRNDNSLANVGGYGAIFSDNSGQAYIVLEAGERIAIVKNAGAASDVGSFDAIIDGVYD